MTTCEHASTTTSTTASTAAARPRAASNALRRSAATLGLAIAVAGAGVATAPASAHAASRTLGAIHETGAVSGTAAGGMVVAVDPEGVSFRVPGAGVLTGWRFRTNGSGGSAKLKTYHRIDLTHYVTGASSPESPWIPPHTTTGWLPLQIQVAAGDRLGVKSFGSVLWGEWGSDTALACDTTDVRWGDPLPGEAVTTSGCTRASLNLQARWESDFDRDRFGDATQDFDDDNDRHADTEDAFPLNRFEWADADRDGAGDNADVDDDNDGLADPQETLVGTSRIDRDSDDDGLGDAREVNMMLTSPTSRDSDGDGVQDGTEAGVATPIADPPGTARGTSTRYFRPDLDPASHTGPRRRDHDGDGLADGHEDANRNGRRDSAETNPRRSDTDRDGRPDGSDPFPLRA